MKISGTVPPAFGDLAPTSASKSVTQPLQVKAGADRVEFSPKAREMRSAVDEVKKMPAVDLKKVAQIKAMLENGTYRTENRKIAARMVEEALLSDQ